MSSPDFYRRQARRCLLLSRATVDPRVRLWLTDLASDYVRKAAPPENKMAVTRSTIPMHYADGCSREP
jgi:hypothetical protein